MFCPKCASEYVEGIVQCPHCKVPLQEEEPQPVPKKWKPKLKIATLLALIGGVYVFCARTVFTLFPTISLNMVISRVNVILWFLASVAWIFFLISFWKEYIKKEQTGLFKATVFAIFGTFLMLLIRIYSLFLVFEINVTLSSNIMQMILTMFPLISILFYLVFLLVFYKEQTGQKQRKLKTATLFAAIGSSVLLLSHLFNLINTYLLNLKVNLTFQSLSQVNFILIAIILPLGIFSFLTHVYFMVTFYKSIITRNKRCPYFSIF